MPSNLDLDAIKESTSACTFVDNLSSEVVPWDAEGVADMHMQADEIVEAVAVVLNAAPALIAEVERLRQELALPRPMQFVGIDWSADAIATAKKIGAAEWQPIETAPKDGTVVDLWVPATKDFPAQIFSDCWYFNGRWALAGFDIDFSWLQKATNWLLKPAPPAELRAEVGE